jgi:hypothetical protein
MKAQSFQVRSLKHQITACLRLVAAKVKSAVLRLIDLESQLEVAMSKQFNFCNVCVSCSHVVVDLDNKCIAYIIQKGYEMGWHYLVKKFNPQGKDLRMLHYASVQGERIDDIRKNSDQQSDEYKAVLKAAYHSEKELVAYGRNCAYPNGFDFGSSRL